MKTDGVSFDEIKDKVVNLDIDHQRRLIMEVIPQVWERVCDDPPCFLTLKELVDSHVTQPYDEIGI